MVTVSISETFDISTKINKMSLIAVHSPTKTLIQKTYPGLAMNHKYFRIKKVDVSLVATSHLPVNPAEVGDTADKIAPQDMLNPILYKAVSNDSWNTLESRLAGLLYRPVPGADNPSVVGNMATGENDGLLAGGDFGVYYGLLSNRDGFKLAHPQQGMSMKGLRPLVFEKWYSNGVNKDAGDDSAPILYEDGTDHTIKIGSAPNNSMRGRPHPMPRLNTTYLTGVGDGTQAPYVKVANGMGDGSPVNAQADMPNVDPVMLACIILPPSARTIMYYRMICRCYIEFTDVRPITEITSFQQLSDAYSPNVYHSDYSLQSAKMDNVTDMVDTNDADIEKSWKVGDMTCSDGCPGRCINSPTGTPKPASNGTASRGLLVFLAWVVYIAITWSINPETSGTTTFANCTVSGILAILSVCTLGSPS